LLRHYSTSNKLINGSSTNLPRYKLQRVTDYINNNLREGLTLDKITASVSMSPYHSARAFRQSTGLAPHRYVLQRRVDSQVPKEVPRQRIRPTISPNEIVQHCVDANCP